MRKKRSNLPTDGRILEIASLFKKREIVMNIFHNAITQILQKKKVKIIH